MRQIREVMRLHFDCGWSKREVARALKMSSTAVWEYIQRAKRAQLSFERVREMSDDALDRLLFPPSPPSTVKRPMPNWAQVHRELGRKHVTLDLLWNEYKLQEPEALDALSLCSLCALCAQRAITAGACSIHAMLPCMLGLSAARLQAQGLPGGTAIRVGLRIVFKGALVEQSIFPGPRRPLAFRA
jgi:hypothetical protein